MGNLSVCNKAFHNWETGEYNILSPKEKQIAKNAFKAGWDSALMEAIVIALEAQKEKEK